MPHTNCRAITAICVQPTQEYFFLWHFCQFHCDAKSLRSRSGLALVFTLQIRCRRTTRFTLLPCCTFSCHTINTICLVVQSFTFYCVMTCLTLLILYQGTILWWMKQGWQRCLLQMHLAVISPKWPKMFTICILILETQMTVLLAAGLIIQSSELTLMKIMYLREPTELLRISSSLVWSGPTYNTPILWVSWGLM